MLQGAKEQVLNHLCPPALQQLGNRCSSCYKTPLCPSPPPPSPPPPPCRCFPRQRLQGSPTASPRLLLAAGQLLRSRVLARAALALPRPGRGVWLGAQWGEGDVAAVRGSHCDTTPCHRGLRGPAPPCMGRAAPLGTSGCCADTPACVSQLIPSRWPRGNSWKPGRSLR